MRARAERAASEWLPALVVPVAAATVLYGAVYPSVYWPLLGACTGAGVAGLLHGERSMATVRAVKRLSMAFAAILLAVALQLVPISRSTVQTLSPATHEYLARVDLTYADAVNAMVARPDAARHSLTVNPRRTLLAWAFVAAFVLYLLGALCILNRAGAAPSLATALSVLGVAVALMGMLVPVPTGAPAGFAPFINRNHFAGWMSMAASLALGAFAARLSALRRRGLQGRSLFLHFGSTDGAKLILAAFAAIVMFASVLLSHSRSGALACVGGLLMMGMFATRPHVKERQSLAAAAAFVGILLVAAFWAGTAPLLARVEDGLGPDLSTRVRAWHDALRVARAFPLAGTGLNTYGDVMLLYQTADSATHYSAAHNDYLQLAAEGGVLLSLPVLVALLVFTREARARLNADDPSTRTYWIRRGAVAALVAIAIQSVFDFSLQIPANALLFVTMCSIAIHDRHPTPQSGGDSTAPRLRLRIVRTGSR
jgi:O-antigen ligase